MPRMTVTERKLTAMLQENTGRSMLDSGDAYGRNWQRNQTRDFRKESATVLENVADYQKMAQTMSQWYSITYSIG